MCYLYNLENQGDPGKPEKSGSAKLTGSSSSAKDRLETYLALNAGQRNHSARPPAQVVVALPVDMKAVIIRPATGQEV